jgi:hypothetical protein
MEFLKLMTKKIKYAIILIFDEIRSLHVERNFREAGEELYHIINKLCNQNMALQC